MRKFASMLGVVGIASALVLAGVPAAAVEPPPPPVAPATGLPSWQGVYYNPDGLTPGTPAYDDWMDSMRARVPAPVQDIKPGSGGGGRAITPAKPFLRGVPAGGASVILTGAYAVGWGIGQGGLLAYGQATGSYNQFDAGMCAVGPIVESVYHSLNFGLGPSCETVMQLIDQNTDQAATYSANFQSPGGTFVITAAQNGWTSSAMTTTRRAYCGTITNGAGYSGGWVVTAYSAPTSGSGYAMTPACPAGSAVLGFGYTSPFTPRDYSFTKAGSPTYTWDARTIEESRADPLRTPTCSITWSDGTTTTGTGQQYRETGAIPINAEGTGCAPAYNGKAGAGTPSGPWPTRIKVDSTPEGGAAQTLSDQTVPTPNADQKAALSTSSTAGLVLSKTVGGQVASCMTWEVDCATWWADTSNGTVPGTYTCTFGGAVVTLTECGIYRNTFVTPTATPTVTDPVTGDPEPWVTAPATGTGANPSAPGNAGSTDPGTSLTPGDACFNSWPPFSLADPITWVMHPVYCAIVKALAPRQAVVDAKFAEAEAVWSTKAPAAIIEAAALIDGMTAPTGCSIPVTILGITADVINVCSGPMEQMPVYTRFITGAYAVIIVFTKIRQQTAAMVNYNVGQT